MERNFIFIMISLLLLSVSIASLIGVRELRIGTMSKPEPSILITESMERDIHRGKASYYSYNLCMNKESNAIRGRNWDCIEGEILIAEDYGKDQLFCATRDFPRYSILLVKNIKNGKYVTCKVLDYGPDEKIHPDRIIDLSTCAFSKIADVSLGVIDVSVEMIQD